MDCAADERPCVESFLRIFLSETTRRPAGDALVAFYLEAMGLADAIFGDSAYHRGTIDLS